ncbi:MEDS domain-containing protein [Ornithinibacillus xuwenensis]|uniref:MEDS domain-containing protein n=1 Tax=Ornithinibacillus xuwenensis TaxID=3144668 RepID=A0ABU9XLB6_9BACI
MVRLTKYLEVQNRAHILYFFQAHQCYLQNLEAYIEEGLKRKHHLIVIENPAIYNELEKKFILNLPKEQQAYIHYINNLSYYNYYHSFDIHNIIEKFSGLLDPFLAQNIVMRTWAHVEWMNQDNIIEKLDEFEKLADCAVSDLGIMSVCAYDSYDITAALQTKLMRSHEYLMTDLEIVKSPFYQKTS